MAITAAAACGLATGIAGVPLAAIGYSMSRNSPAYLPLQWWRNSSSRWLWTAALVLLAGVVSALAGFRVRGTFALYAYAGLCLLGTTAAVVDISCKRLPFVLTIPMLGICLSGITTQSVADDRFAGLVRVLLGGIIVAGFFLALALAAPGQLGLGDVVFAGVLFGSLGWLGWSQFFLGVLAALTLALLARLIIRAYRLPGGARREFAFGPFLLAGWIVGVLVGS